MKLVCRDKTLDLGSPVVMGVLNVTPDSFSDGGRHFGIDQAVARAQEMVAEGATLIDVGGESTRPGAQPVDEAEELRRVIPVIERIAGLPAVISVDTSKPAVMRAACAAGAGLINDVYALRRPGALETAAASGAAVCLMHMQGEPRTMQANPCYADVVREIGDFLADRRRACLSAGIAADRILLDPGFGFGKTLAHNLRLLARLDTLRRLGAPLLVGLSRKSMLGAITGQPPGERLPAGLAAAALAVWQGASIIRTHDVRATVEAVKLAAAARQQALQEA
ncbi:MAG TPA: dihydropteroate synthase [Nevskiales bacterium]|nr:dihydropteroate synthase [Nevskiales bacterium]